MLRVLLLSLSVVAIAHAELCKPDAQNAFKVRLSIKTALGDNAYAWDANEEYLFKAMVAFAMRRYSSKNTTQISNVLLCNVTDRVSFWFVVTDSSKNVTTVPGSEVEAAIRPMVLSDSHLLRIAVPNASRSTAYCSFDGKGRVELRQGDYVTVEASQYPFPTVVSDSGEWFTSVQRALRWNTRGAVQKSWDGGAEGDPEEAEDEQWDIDTDAGLAGTDSGIGPSEDGDALSPNPMRRQMSLLNM